MASRQIIIEAAVETADCAKAALGADRLELCSALDLGGLTPTLGLVAETKTVTTLPLCLMIRPRPGNFVYTDTEFRVMQRDCKELLQFKPSAFVFGILTAKGYIDEIRCKQLVDMAQGIPCVFHRAFDRAKNLDHSLEALVGLGFKRILTSGRAASAVEGIRLLAELQTLSAGRIEILPCGGIRSKNVAEVLKGTGITQVHGSFAEEVPLEKGQALRGYSPQKRLSVTELAATRAKVDKLF